MAKKQNNMQSAVLKWAYENRKSRSKAANVLKSIEEAEKTLENVKIKKKT